MTGIIQSGRIPAALLGMALIFVTFGGLSADAHERDYGWRHHGRARGALVGGTVGLVVGALIGGGRGALIGVGTGAGTGYLVQRYRNHRHWRRDYYWHRHRYGRRHHYRRR